jgi:hypothetical protein
MRNLKEKASLPLGTACNLPTETNCNWGKPWRKKKLTREKSTMQKSRCDISYIMLLFYACSGSWWPSHTRRHIHKGSIGSSQTTKSVQATSSPAANNTCSMPTCLLACSSTSILCYVYVPIRARIRSLCFIQDIRAQIRTLLSRHKA